MDQYLVYGNPIDHSRSPCIHLAFSRQTEQAIRYKKQLVELDGFQQAVEAFVAQGGKGANVTAPFKEQAMALCDELTERAKLSGAVNTLIIKNGKIFGDTTDGIGLVNDLLANDIVLKNQRVLLLGAGGAAKGVILPLLEQNVKQLTIANRTVSKAQIIVEQYKNHPFNACSFDEANQQQFDVIINATSAGLSGNGVPIADKLITPETSCYDMTYGKTLSPFLQKAAQQNAKKVVDGLGMLVQQAAASFYIWRGVKPDSHDVLEKLRKEMA
jgi:shikimate dehydrogenase